MFNDFLSGFFGGIPQQFAAGGQQQYNRPSEQTITPPASRRTLENLNLVTITVDDLQEEGNKECLICLEDQTLGSQACKLPCGHIFHQACVKQWLAKHAQCPSCRYELETNDPDYERLRKERMKTRKLRIRRNELDKKSISQLRTLCGSLSIDTRDCFDKRDIIDKLVQSGKIDVTESAPVMEVTRDELYGKSVKELQHLLLSFGITVDTRMVQEKSDLCQLLLDSQRVVLVERSPQKCSDSSPAAPAVAAATSSSEALSFSKDELRGMTMSELRALSARVGVSLYGCCEKQDVISKILTSPLVHIIDYEHDSRFENYPTNECGDSSPSPAKKAMFGGFGQVIDDPSDGFEEQRRKGMQDRDSWVDEDQGKDPQPAQSSSSYSSSHFQSASSHSNVYDHRDATGDPGAGTGTGAGTSTADGLSIKELRGIADAMHVSLAGCLEKQDMVQRLRDAGIMP